LVLRVLSAKLQHTATHCNTPQHTAAHHSTPQHTAARRSTPQHTAAHRNTLQHTATHRNTPQHTAAHRNTPQHTATHRNTLQHTATHLPHLGLARVERHRLKQPQHIPETSLHCVGKTTQCSFYFGQIDLAVVVEVERRHKNLHLVC